MSGEESPPVGAKASVPRAQPDSNCSDEESTNRIRGKVRSVKMYQEDPEEGYEPDISSGDDADESDNEQERGQPTGFAAELDKLPSSIPENKWKSVWASSSSEESDDSTGEDVGDLEHLRKRVIRESEARNYDTVVELLDAEPKLLTAADSDGYILLHKAAYMGDMTLVKELLERGADINAKTHDGWQPLHSACRWNHVDVASLLLQAGADVNATSSGGNTPLHVAASNANAKQALVLLLSNRYIDPNILNDSSESAFDLARRSGPHYHLFEMVEDSLDVDGRGMSFQHFSEAMGLETVGENDQKPAGRNGITSKTDASM
ncbi:PREDICTED: ankyrin repeat domain-containing protein 49-like isoform X1 [Branchiostoma belcheri]|uniref:Ankyrin repeat domain-containing protein 49-like isoform X1 n=1 Tax=Branchiostoma belcheri TaxID=7741 RepID=A0A6P4Z2S9_BRABE|nr:PREDICTED: ankyrin repeat domain-containing protein 49-like isoform X1 [Branchiostoma belcheri]XP_019630873.1 PREDICTED: ankyrin repeat domain-containing protein 49-like isoform X2 [Branchiostoma belcheri]XP_019630874.1 PREDICTED: ankyrin repeat domain-containing protein 49-like isoform X2 [Branchiostoma belcheri]XP_019630875.1 PREDICTED: ankyrin repeat domain-containing protein 49-like isoform X1 [Branchiostoma belcheri]KAI8484366.1 spermatogenesis [Branchiostoma belcheri]